MYGRASRYRPGKTTRICWVYRPAAPATCTVHKLGRWNEFPLERFFVAKQHPHDYTAAIYSCSFFTIIFFGCETQKTRENSPFRRSSRYPPRCVFPSPFPKRTQRPPQRPTKARSFSCPASLLTMMPCMRTWRRSWFQQHRMCQARLDI